MRCLSCNALLNDFEATRRGANSMDFIDLCNRCFGYIADEVPVLEREDLDEENLYDTSMEDLDLDNDD